MMNQEDQDRLSTHFGQIWLVHNDAFYDLLVSSDGTSAAISTACW